MRILLLVAPMRKVDKRDEKFLLTSYEAMSCPWLMCVWGISKQKSSMRASVLLA